MNTDIKRPEIPSRTLAESIAERFRTQLLAYLSYKESAWPNVRESLVEALEFSCSFDGYELARHLEANHGWSPNERLVALLGLAEVYKMEAEARFETAWVKEQGITLAKDIDDVVSVKVRGVTYTGKIVSLNRPHAKYAVNVPDLGHIPPGQTGGTTAVYVKAEEIEGGVTISLPLIPAEVDHGARANA